MLKKITNFGTCRVFNAMHLLVKEKKIQLNNGQFINYTQNMPEILQETRIMTQEQRIPVELEPYFFDKYLAPEDERKYPDISQTDLVVCEISTARCYSYEGVYFQINHLMRNLINPHGDLLKPWFEAANARNQPAREQALEAVLATDHALSELEIDILHKLKIEQQTPHEVRRDVRALRRMIPAPVLLVTHCDVIGNAGERIHSRVALIENVARIARDENLALYQPSVLIEKYGQSTVMGDGGKDSNHYDPEFYPVLAEHLYSNWMS